MGAEAHKTDPPLGRTPSALQTGAPSTLDQASFVSEFIKKCKDKI
jgi:hypothetical protein